MRTFELVRTEDATGISGTEVVACGVRFDDGTVAMRWMTLLRSTSIYDDIRRVIAIHGHNGKTLVRWLGPFGHGFADATFDRMESVLETCLDTLKLPSYIQPKDEVEYFQGYHAAHDGDPEYKGSLVQ